MDIGIFSRTFARPTLDGVLDAVASHGLSQVHFNLKSAGVASLPDEISDALCGQIRHSFESRGLTMTSISGTFNAIHPDIAQRDLDARSACLLIERCKQLGTSVVSLCTGTRDPEDMWKQHPGNSLPDAWRDLLATFERLVAVAEANGVVLGIEPEVNNVIDSARSARRLLDEFQTPHLQIILDGANLFDPQDVSAPQAAVLTEAFELLAGDLVMVHAKDITGDPAHTDQAAGTGRLDWVTYCRLIAESGYDGPVVLHNLREEEVDGSVSFVRSHLAKWHSGSGDLKNTNANFRA